MRRGAELLGIAFDAQRAAAATLQTLRANGHRDAYIRPLAWVGAGSFGLDVTGHSQHLMVATTPTLVHLGGTRTRLTVSPWRRNPASRSEEHTSELQSLMRNSYAVFCLKKKQPRKTNMKRS